MPVAIDPSVLIAAERQGAGLSPLLPVGEAEFYIPALAAAEFMIGIHPPVRAELRNRASELIKRSCDLWFLLSLRWTPRN